MPKAVIGMSLGKILKLRSLLCLAVFFLSACPTLADALYGFAGPLQQVESLSPVELGRLSLAALQQSDQRLGSLRRCVDAPRAERVAKAAISSLNSVDRFALGKKIVDPVTLQVPTKLLHERTIGQIRNKSFAKYSSFDDYWKASGTGIRGKFFESQSVLQANSALKKQGSAYRYAITAVEGDPTNAADVVLLDSKGKIVRRFQFKSTRNVDDIIGFAMEPKYADMPIITHPETVAELQKRLASEVQKAARRGKPLPPKWQAVQDKLANGLITDSLVEGKPVASYATTTENARRFRLYQWRKGPSKVVSGKRATRIITQSVAVPRTLSRTGILVARVAKGTLLVLEVVSAPLDIGLAAYGFHDTYSRYSQGTLDQDLFAAKLAIHATEAALGGVAVYTLSVGLGLMTAPEPIVTKVSGIVVVVGSVAVITADMAISAITSNRDQARQQTLVALTEHERYLAVREDLAETLTAIFRHSSSEVFRTE